MQSSMSNKVVFLFQVTFNVSHLFLKRAILFFPSFMLLFNRPVLEGLALSRTSTGAFQFKEVSRLVSALKG